MSAHSFPDSLLRPIAAQVASGPVSFGVLSTYPPTRCGLATFSAALSDGLCANGVEVGVVQVADGEHSSNARVIGQLVNGSAASIAACSDLLNQHDVAIIQHEYGIYGGVDGDDVRRRHRRAARSVHRDRPHNSQRPDPTPAFGPRGGRGGRRSGGRDVCGGPATPPSRLRRRSPEGHHDSARRDRPAQGSPSGRFGRPTLLTWGLLGPGKGIERVIDVMGSLRDLPGRPRYLVAGRTHPKVLAAEGEAYRDGLAAQAQRKGVSDSVSFDPNYRGAASLTALIQSAAVIVLPYDSTDQVTSGVLVDAIASGRPVVATAFPHAVELLASGAGILVDHDDPDALATALRRLLTEPRLAGCNGRGGSQVGADDGLAGRGQGVPGPGAPARSPSGRHSYDRGARRARLRPSAAPDRSTRHLRARLSDRSRARARLLHRRHGPGPRRR